MALWEAQTHRGRNVSGEGQARIFLSREEWPAGTGEKDRGQRQGNLDELLDEQHVAHATGRKGCHYLCQALNDQRGKWRNSASRLRCACLRGHPAIQMREVHGNARSPWTSRAGRRDRAMMMGQLTKAKPKRVRSAWERDGANQSRSANCSRSATVATSPCCVRIDRYSSTLLGGFLRRARTLRSAEQTRPGARESWFRKKSSGC